MERRSSDVPSTNAAFAYQFVRALYWLVQADQDQYVGVEYIDDIALLDSGKNPLKTDQAKFTAKNTFAATNRSVALWKTLANWTRMAAALSINQFIISTTRPPNATHLAQKMSDASTRDDIKACADFLLEQAASPVDTLAPFLTQVAGTQAEVLHHIIKNFSLVVANPDDDCAGTDLYTEIVKKLCPPPHVDQNQLIESLIGWIDRTLLSQWNRGEQGIISKLSFTTQYHRLVSSPSIDPTKPRPWHQIVNDISSDKILLAQGELFVRQMREISLDDDEVIDGIQCYYGASIERIRLTHEGELTYEDISTHNHKCHSRWKKEFQKQQHRRSTTKIERGRDLYYTITSHSRQNELPFDPNLIEGIYHRLANNEEASLFLGWHPDYKLIFIKVIDA